MPLDFTQVEPVVRTWTADNGSGKAYEVSVTKQALPTRYSLDVKINGNSQGIILLDTVEELADILAQVGGDLSAELGG